jgi:GntR family transcriptional repressor for pyruvate dehydrogenase complex
VIRQGMAKATEARARRPKRPKGDLVAARVSSQLREELLELPDGAFIGLEDDLLAKFHVSRPTLRQAARVLESEQLLTVRRGVGGGYYARRPNMDAVGRVAASFLKSRQTSLNQLLQTARALMRGIATTAAASPNIEARARLQAIYDEVSRVPAGVLDLAEFERKIGGGIVALADNPTLELFMAVLYQVGLRDRRPMDFEGHPERMATYVKLRLGLVEAILRGDAEVTDLMSARWSAQLLSWLQEDERSTVIGEDEVWIQDRTRPSPSANLLL